MSTSTKVVVTGGAALVACAACCAISIVPAVLAGSGLAALGGATALWGSAALLLVVPIAGVVYLSRRRFKASADNQAAFQNLIASSDGCNCSDSCRSKPPKEEAPIACTLDSDDFKTRTASTRALASRSLRITKRTPLTLSLVYGPEALGEVQELVRKEEDCCAFLTFDLKHDAAGVYLTITAPAATAEAADILFDHFAPDLARDVHTKEAAE